MQGTQQDWPTALEIVRDFANEWRERARAVESGGRQGAEREIELLREHAYDLEREFGIETRVVAIYEVDQTYGGPEEGGWWFDTGTRYAGFEPIVAHGRAEIEAACAKARAFVSEHKLNEGRHEPSSVLCAGWYSDVTFQGPDAPENFPAKRPRYE